MKKVWILGVCAVLLITGSGCGLLTNKESTEADAAKEAKGPKVAKIEFGDYPQDEGNFKVLNKRKHFGKDENFALVFRLPKGKQFDTTRLKFQIINKKGDRVLQEIIQEVEPDSSKYKWEFSSDFDFHGFYETGDYQIKVWRGKDLLAEGDFIITE
ncbi:hypothetical protein C8P63_1184 [Melghirimyces profundicolus]|uniref:Intracellular proteinase inhibitor BsuPI n=1 Tax=Melghirimyces profundicolus TaxID=1242148 RepID=A0A2T6BPY6_9BACL|nr:hypothetical protein [Melghirimyces profundicolus]PTX58131.1 hypothetical protein C8P63_1184 [Melghirimyces profundicolus]